MPELDVVLEQLEELLAEGARTPDDALEIATVAGLASRLGGESHPLVARAMEWKKGASDLLDRAFAELDLEEIVGGIDGVLDGAASEEMVEEAVYELDDVVVAAVWTGRRTAVKAAAAAVAETIRQIPEPFAALSDFGVQMARSAAVARDIDLYDYWLAIADAGAVREPK